MFHLLLAIVFPLIWTNMPEANSEQASLSDKPIKLTAGSTKVLAIPSFAAETGPQCDSSGNLYFRTGRSPRTTVVLKIAARDDAATVYQVTDQAASESYFVAFHVGSQHRIAILMGGKHDEPSVYQFNEQDPLRVSNTAIEAPAGLSASSIQSFVILPNDHILLQGYFGEGTPDDKIGHSYLAEFAPSGKLLRLSLNKASEDVLKSVAQRGAKTEAAQGQDGMTYLLTADRVIVFSHAGSVDREIKLSPPESGYYPDVLYSHARRLVVGFYPSPVPGKPVKHALFQLLDPSDGEVLRTFETASELGNNLVCFSDEGLTFLKVDNRQLKLVSAPIR